MPTLKSKFEIFDIVSAQGNFLDASEYIITEMSYRVKPIGFQGARDNTFVYSLLPLTNDGGSGVTHEDMISFIRKPTEHEREIARTHHWC